MAIGDELASLDFEAMLGGPLIAVVKAQSMAATTSVDYIKAVGFTGGDQADPAQMTPTSVKFSYDKPVETTNAQTGETTVEHQKHTLEVPFLTMLPIPFIRIEETTIDFNAKINSVQSVDTKSQHGLNTELTAKAGWLWGSAKLKVNYSYQKTSTRGEKTERTYTMKVHIRAVQDEMPAGTERLLSILENAIKETPAQAQGGG